MASLCHPSFTTTKLSYRFPIFETSATALCGTTGSLPEVIPWSHWFIINILENWASSSKTQWTWLSSLTFVSPGQPWHCPSVGPVDLAHFIATYAARCLAQPPSRFKQNTQRKLTKVRGPRFFRTKTSSESLKHVFVWKIEKTPKLNFLDGCIFQFRDLSDRY